LEIALKVNLGVDLEKLKVALNAKDEIVVCGIKPEVQGFLDRKDSWKAKEIRIHKGNHHVLWDDIQVDQGHKDLHAKAEHHRSTVEKRLKNGADFRCYDVIVKQCVQQVIALLFSPMRKKVVFVESTKLQTKGLWEFIEDYNRLCELSVGKIEHAKSRPALPSS
jgi:hypothetical protein